MQPDNQFSPQVTPAPQPETQPPYQQPATSAPTVSEPQTPSAFTPQSASTLAAKKNFGKKKLGLLAGIVAGVLLLGGAAAAFFVYQEQNKPENVLKAAMENMFKAKSASFDGKFSFSQEGTAATVNLKGQSNIEQSAFQLEADVTISGVNVPFELRSLDKSVYFKLSNLDPVVNLIAGSAPQYGGIVKQVADKVDDQWIEIDETLLSQAGASCVLDTDMSLTEDDRNLLFSAYEKQPFATVKSTSDDKVNDRSAIKYDIEIDNAKAAEYGKVFKDLSVFQKLKECNSELEESFDSTTDTEESDNINFTLWVDKSAKEVVKLASSISEDGMESDFEMTFNYDAVTVTKPEGARPVMEVIGELSSLMNGGFELPAGSTGRALGDFIEI